MGNEMGNNNVSGLQVAEDEKARSEEVQGKLSKEEISADELNGENHGEPEAEEKKFHAKQNFDEKGNTITKRENNTSPIGEGKDFNESEFCSETPLVAGEPQVENETADEKDENDIKSKPPRALEIPAESDDAPDLDGVQEFASSSISDLSAKDAKNLDENLITENEHPIKKEITIGRENTETDGPTVDSNAGSCNLDPDSDQHEVHLEQVAGGSSISEGESEESVGLSASAQSENSHLVNNEVAENIYLCVIPEDGDNLLVKTKVSEEEACQRMSNEAKVCDGDESPLDALQPLPETQNSAVEASDPQLEDSKSPVEASEVPLVEDVNSPMETFEPPQEASEPPVELSNSRVEALTSSLESSKPPLEALKSALEALKPPVEVSESPLEASHPQLQAIMSPPKASNPPLEAPELPVEASKLQAEGLEEASKSPPETSELQREALDSLLEPSESQPEAFPQPSPINSRQKNYKPQDIIIDVPLEAKLIASKMENGETKLDSNQTQRFGENDKNSESNASQSESMSMDSDCNKSDRENASNSSIMEDFVASESELHINEPQVAVVKQPLMQCSQEQPEMEKSMLLMEETKFVGSEVESKYNGCNHNLIEFDDEVKDLKTDVEKNGKQSALMFSSSHNIGEDCQFENLGVNPNEIEVSFVDKNLEQLEESDEVNAEVVSERKALPTELTETESSREEDMHREEFDDKYKQSLSLENDADKGDNIGQLMSPNSTQQAEDLPPRFSNSEAAEDKNESISDSISDFSIIAENFNASLSNAIEQSMVPAHGLQQNIQPTSVMFGETEAPPVMFDEQSDKAQNTVEKLMTESSLESPSNHVEFRKSPSFHFDLSIGSRSEESDQTPLLCHDKTAGRSLSSQGNAMSQKDSVQTDYSSSQNEAILVEEKTIRMERSDSERPSAPFLSLIQKEEIAQVSVTPEKQQENLAADKKRKDTWTVIHKTFALNSPRDSTGKRKSMSSIFSTCICCAAKIP